MLRPDCPAPAAVERFAADLAALLPTQGRLGIAVSGGPDSMALLLLAHAALNGAVEAATVDHGLRPESGAEAALVAELCRRMGVAHEIIRVEVAAGNLQSAARVARYRALNEWVARRGLAALATAHHADDQAETLLMRLNRGSGIAGLAGIRASGDAPEGGGMLIRPLLDWRKAELRAIVTAAGVGFAEDPSNRDETFDRVAMRRQLAETDWLDPAALSRSARHLAEAEAAMSAFVDTIWHDAVIRQDHSCVYLPDLAPAGSRQFIAKQIMRRILGRDAKVRGSEIARAVDRLRGGQPATLGGQQVRVTERDGDTAWLFTPETPRRND